MKTTSAKTFLLFLFTAISIKINAQAWQWAYPELSSGSYNFFYDVAHDSKGNLYAAGSMGTTSTFGSITVSNKSIRDYLIAKFDTLGNYIWVRNNGLGVATNKAAMIQSICIDAQDNIYAVGNFSDSLIVGNDTLIEPFNQFGSGFIMKMDTAGNYIWAQAIPAAIYGYTVSVDCDAAGNVYIAGNFNQVGSFGPFVLVSNTTVYTDPYIAKLDGAGNWIFAQKLNASTSAEVTHMHVTNSGQITVTGTFRGYMTFGSAFITNNDAFVDVFVASADSGGNWQWAKQYYGNTLETAYTFGMDVNKANGDIYITGKFQDTVIFDIDTGFVSNGYEDMYITKTDNNGNLQWLKTTGISDVRGIDISVMDNGNILMGGYFRDSVLFDNIMLNDTGSNQSFCAELSAAGNWQWALGSTTAGMNSASQINAVTHGPFGDVYITGQCGWPTNFGSFQLNSIGSQIFIAKIDLDSLPTGMHQQNSSATLQVWPNPVNDVINVYCPNALKDKCSIYVYNTTGQCIFTKPNCNVSEKLNMRSYPTGMYMLKVGHDSRLIIKE